jgi:hypothetical protein
MSYINHRRGSHVRAAFIIGALSVVLGSCSFNFDIAKWGTLNCSIVESESRQARSVIPALSVATYVLSFSGPSAVAPQTLSAASASVSLPVGTWSVAVQGFNAAGSLVAEGSQSGVVITENATTSISINISAIARSTGSVSISVSWPTSLLPAVDSVTAELDGSAVGPGGLSVNLAAGTALYSATIASGNHIFSMSLRRGSAETVTLTEALQVNDNLLAEKAIVLASADFTQVPDAPAALSAAEGTAGIVLSWTCASRVETGFRIERRPVGSSAWASISTPAANASQHVDSGAASGVSYEYRAFAVNALGDSAASNAASGSWAPPAAGGASVSAVSANAISLGWTPASDASTPQASIQYCVVRSASNNIGTVQLALANGISVMPWGSATSCTASGLSSSTPYYFAVLARDSALNACAYTTVSGTTSAGSGGLGIVITVSSPTSEPITFNQSEYIYVSQSGSLGVGISQSFDSYQWRLDGAAIPGATSGTLSLPCASLSLGAHRVAVFVMKAGKLYSDEFSFNVGN